MSRIDSCRTLHEIEKHNKSREKYQVDPSCLKCYSTNEIEIGDWFKRFFKKKDGEESYPSSKKKRNRELEKIRKEGKKLLDIVVRLIRYRNKLDYRKIGIISVIKVICEHYILSEDNEFILDDRTEENLLGNKE
ncbi:hypothetical protein RhiirA4_465287, partial [Rhizophagus irregularis]